MGLLGALRGIPGSSDGGAGAPGPSPRDATPSCPPIRPDPAPPPSRAAASSASAAADGGSGSGASSGAAAGSEPSVLPAKSGVHERQYTLWQLRAGAQRRLMSEHMKSPIPFTTILRDADLRGLTEWKLRHVVNLARAWSQDPQRQLDYACSYEQPSKASNALKDRRIFTEDEERLMVSTCSFAAMSGYPLDKARINDMMLSIIHRRQRQDHHRPRPGRLRDHQALSHGRTVCDWTRLSRTVCDGHVPYRTYRIGLDCHAPYRTYRIRRDGHVPYAIVTYRMRWPMYAYDMKPTLTWVPSTRTWILTSTRLRSTST